MWWIGIRSRAFLISIISIVQFNEILRSANTPSIKWDETFDDFESKSNVHLLLEWWCTRALRQRVFFQLFLAFKAISNSMLWARFCHTHHAIAGKQRVKEGEERKKGDRQRNTCSQFTRFLPFPAYYYFFSLACSKQRRHEILMFTRLNLHLFVALNSSARFKMRWKISSTTTMTRKKRVCYNISWYKHILTLAVWSWYKKWPVNAQFFCLRKRSLNTNEWNFVYLWAEAMVAASMAARKRGWFVLSGAMFYTRRRHGLTSNLKWKCSHLYTLEYSLYLVRSHTLGLSRNSDSARDGRLFVGSFGRSCSLGDGFNMLVHYFACRHNLPIYSLQPERIFTKEFANKLNLMYT